MPSSHSFLPLRALAGRASVADPFHLRVQRFGAEKSQGDFVLYWAQAHRRIEQNLALELAIAEADRRSLPVVVYESLRPDQPGANDRIHSFVLQSVAEKEARAEERGVHYRFFLPRTRDDARGMLRRISGQARLIVTDEFPTYIFPQQTKRLIAQSEAPVVTVDANAILPMRIFEKEQYSARFLRDRAHRLFPQYWMALRHSTPRVTRWNGELPFEAERGEKVDAAVGECEIDHGVKPVSAIGSRSEGLRKLERFVNERLDGYADEHNRRAAGSSELSPYLHFGYLSVHEIANRVLQSGAAKEDIDAFLEELIIRRELSFNLCFYNPDHASLNALPKWANETLQRHRDDRRKPLYRFEELERAETHDEVWNLAQRALLRTGTIHNYLRMLWGKKIIEWSATPDEAHATMLLLHDKYAIDGRDPNTHAGLLWCFGKHDRPWAPERPIFGTIRYMSSEATKKKVDLRGYAAVVG